MVESLLLFVSGKEKQDLAQILFFETQTSNPQVAVESLEIIASNDILAAEKIRKAYCVWE